MTTSKDVEPGIPVVVIHSTNDTFYVEPIEKDMVPNKNDFVSGMMMLSTSEARRKGEIGYLKRFESWYFVPNGSAINSVHEFRLRNALRKVLSTESNMTLDEINQQTALTWAARACAFLNRYKVQGYNSGSDLLVQASEAKHEALEHAAVSSDLSLLVYLKSIPEFSQIP